MPSIIDNMTGIRNDQQNLRFHMIHWDNMMARIEQHITCISPLAPLSSSTKDPTSVKSSHE